MAQKDAVSKIWLIEPSWNGRVYSDPAKVPPEGEVLFFDDFSSGDMANYNAYFRWGDGEFPSAGAGASSVVSVTGPTGSTINARRMRYGTTAGGDEQRFALTTAIDEVRDRDGSSSTAYQRMCLAYDFFTPSVYTHLDNLPGGEGADNNKWWVTAWKDQYGHSAELSKVWGSLETWPTGDDVGKSMIRFMWQDPAGGSVPSTLEPDTIAVDRVIASSANGYGVKGSDIGTWGHIVMDFRCSDIGQTNGFMRVYRAPYSGGVRGAHELMFSMENMDNSTNVPGSPGTNGFDRGYLLGYCNSTYPETVDFLIANFAFAMTAQDVGVP